MYERFRAEKVKASSALENAVCPLSFYIFKGEALGVLGMEGEERDGLIRLLSGQEKMIQGKIWLDGKEIKISSVYDGQREGIYLVKQESRLFSHCNIGENFILMYKREGRLLVNWQRVQQHLWYLSEEYGLSLDPDRPVSEMTLCQRHLFEMALASYSGARVIIIDRIDALYSEEEYAAYEKMIRRLKEKGISFLMIHADLMRARALSERVMVIRKGDKAGTFYTKETKPDLLYKVMTGSEKSERSSRKSYRQPEAVMEAFHLRAPGIVEDLSFCLNRGEIIGFVNEKYETIEKILLLLRGTYGLEGGKLYIDHQEVEPFGEMEAARRGIRYIGRSSTRENVFPDLSVEENLQLELYKPWQYGGGIINRRLVHYAMKRKSGLFLSQKKLYSPLYLLDHNERMMIALYRWKMADMRVLLMDAPTMPAEVVLRKYIRSYIKEICLSGTAIIYSSPSTEEMLELCDCVYVVEKGKISRCLRGMPGERYEEM
ncbi:MAG: ATP-binding cassette domain-containing protein [Ruminococcus sp.]